MKKFLLVSCIAVLLAFGRAAYAQRIDTGAPDQMIKTITSDIMHTVKGDPALQAGDIEKITALVNQKILPYADFTRTTRMAMGPAWNRASAQQRQQIVEQFKMLLIHIYAGAISQIRNQKIQYDPPLNSLSDAQEVVVHTTVINEGRPPQKISYRLEKTSAGWRVYDLNVLGTWVIQLYRGQFSDKIREGGIDGLLQFLKQRNQELSNTPAGQ
jgi:phospholipid transport system substrate-binding protein